MKRAVIASFIAMAFQLALHAQPGLDADAGPHTAAADGYAVFAKKLIM